MKRGYVIAKKFPYLAIQFYARHKGAGPFTSSEIWTADFDKAVKFDTIKEAADRGVKDHVFPGYSVLYWEAERGVNILKETR